MVRYSLDCLKTLAFDAVSVETMVEMGTLDTLLRVLAMNPYHPEIATLVNQTLAHLCKNEALAAVLCAISCVRA